jgi:putative thioredoxin
MFVARLNIVRFTPALRMLLPEFPDSSLNNDSPEPLAELSRLRLVRCQIAAGDLENAQATFALVPPAKAADPEVLSAKAALDMALNPVDVSEIGTLRAAIEKNPDDFQARLDLAVLLNGAGEREQATDQLIHVIRKMRSWTDEAARKQLVKFFEAWGPKDEFTLAGRRKLSSVLFS